MTDMLFSQDKSHRVGFSILRFYWIKSRISTVYSTRLSAVLQHLLVLNVKPFSNGKCISELMLSITFHCKAMFAVGWLELGEAEKAHHLLDKCFRNIQGPFQVSSWLTHPPQPKLLTWMLFESAITSPHRCGVNYQMALVSSTFSQEWEDSCRLCCLGILASGQLSINIKLQNKQSSSNDPDFFFILLDFRRSAWPFPLFFPLMLLNSAFVVWTIWAVRWIGCWGKMMFVLY